MRTWRGFRAPQVYSPSTRACAYARPWFFCCILYCAFPPRDARHNTRSLAELWQSLARKIRKTALSTISENAVSPNVYRGFTPVDNFLNFFWKHGRVLADFRWSAAANWTVCRPHGGVGCPVPVDVDIPPLPHCLATCRLPTRHMTDSCDSSILRSGTSCGVRPHLPHSSIVASAIAVAALRNF